MAGDLGITERTVWNQPEAALAPAAGEQDERIIHRYGRLGILAVPRGGPADSAAEAIPATDELSDVERIGLSAFRLRESAEFRTSKDNRPRDGETWDMPDCTTIVPPPPDAQLTQSITPGAPAPAPTSAYLEGSVAVGIIIVQGPTADLQFTDAEAIKAVAEVQNGLGFYAVQNPLAGITFAYDIQNVTLTTPADPAAADKEAIFRDGAMAAMGFPANWNGVVAYVESLRSEFGTRWTYCAFITKYPVNHFAYAYFGGPHLVMDYRNDGWGPDNIDRVFAHETGHIFNAPDEYAASGCTCGGAFGRYGVANGNCETCAAGGGVSCLMKANDFALCEYTPSHLGWSPQLVIRNFGYSAGGWRVESHPRLMADTSNDKRADMVGFGNAGVYVSRALASGGFEPPVLRVGDFGYVAGGWRVDKHPRMLADTTADGRADIVGFGDAGVYVSRAQADGSFDALRLVVPDFGYVAGGWRVDRHPRFMADTTADGRADIVGFGDAGVYVSRAQANGSYDALRLVVANFGYTAGGWRVERHPRFMADTTGDKRADIVGFGDAGVWISRAQPNGSYTAPQLVVNNFGYTAGGWRVEKHPRFVADLTGDGRADILGFGDAGVWISLAQADGSYSAPELVVANFGYVAGGWRVENHPRFLADTTGDGRLDIVGFGDAGVWVSRSLGGGKFEPPGLVVTNFGYVAGGWRVDKHPRFVVDSTGDGKADIIGCGDAGVWFARS
ncbi:VCBS repeat-containing protein [Actinoplanes sp. LDG1-06]|uniref:VCBS repeat-containing protein n=1 Tax=Paractinoplanes ovalisporus TaxID=2810368 RepID=A0ABS2AFD1_9ACTN|nr:VCBS repeat-containing protein [Actinoplanes ovalisporus]MBM2618523.1 VCBS repeat-containing protein [Actinoplanes ovalisporus]